jgi:hypothetical protein
MLIFACAWRHAYRQALFCILLGVCRVRQRRKTRMQNRAFLLGSEWKRYGSRYPAMKASMKLAIKGVCEHLDAALMGGC